MRLKPAFRSGLTLLGLALTVAYLRIAVFRVIYPFALDLVEEGILLQALQVASRQPVFVPPNADFVPQVYMPLYTWLSGLLLRLTGFAFWPLRLISFACTLISAVLLFVIGRRESHDSLVALWGSLIFIGGYRLVGGWYDLGRVDTLFLALTLAGMATATYLHGSSWGTLLAGLFMGLSLLAKQNGLFLAVVVGLYLWRAARRRWWHYLLGFSLVTFIPLLYLQLKSDGWFSYYVVDIAYASPLDLRRLWHAFGGEFLAGMGILGLMAGVAALEQWRIDQFATLYRTPWFLFGGAALLVTLAGRASVGGNLNNLIIGYGLICLSPSLLAGTMKAQARAVPSWAPTLLYLGVFGQLLLNQFQPYGARPPSLMPTPEMEAAGHNLVKQLSAVNGDVLVMMHPSYAVMAGKAAGVHLQSLWHARHRGQDPFPSEFVQRISKRHYRLIISDDSPFFEQDPLLVTLLEQHYRLERRLAVNEAPGTLSGLVIRPMLVYAPKAQAED